MANNQITPFQLTDQFTMDNFNQRINETNTALQNNDPKQWGLGTNPPFVTDFNDAKLPGWYSGDPAVNYPSKIQYGGYGMVFVQGYRNGLITQRWTWQHNSFLPQLTEAIRYYNPDNELWSEWEYINPPMLLGVEYRTTERYMGINPVYVRLVDCGTFTVSASSTEVNIVVDTVANMGVNFRIISCEGVQYIANIDQITTPTVTDAWSCYVRAGCWTDSQNIRQWGVTVNYGTLTEPYHVYAIVKYTY